jgi:hypothetical protein
VDDLCEVRAVVDLWAEILPGILMAEDDGANSRNLSPLMYMEQIRFLSHAQLKMTEEVLVNNCGTCDVAIVVMETAAVRDQIT